MDSESWYRGMGCLMWFAIIGMVAVFGGAVFAVVKLIMALVRWSL